MLIFPPSQPWWYTALSTLPTALLVDCEILRRWDAKKVLVMMGSMECWDLACALSCFQRLWNGFLCHILPPRCAALPQANQVNWLPKLNVTIKLYSLLFTLEVSSISYSNRKSAEYFSSNSWKLG